MSWRQFLGEALTTWQSYTDGFKKQEAELVSRIEEAKACLVSSKEVFEECRSALSDLTKTDQQLIEGAEAMSVESEDKDDPSATRLQQDLEIMHGHLAALKNNAEVMMAEDQASAKRPRLAEEPPLPASPAAPATPAVPGSEAMKPFGGARK